MKIYSFTIRFILLIPILCGASAGCAAPTPLPASTPVATRTSTPTATITPTETAAPIEAEHLKVTEKEFSAMTDEQKQEVFDKAPEIEELTKGNFSTVKENLVIYRDKDGKAQKVYNIFTGKEASLSDAGIIEFDLTDGGKYEMRSFDTPEVALSYITKNSFWYIDSEANKHTIETSWFNTPEAYEFVIPLKKIDARNR